MKINNIKIVLNNGGGDLRLKGYVSIVINDQGLSFTINDIKIIEGPCKLFISMPSQKMKNGFHKDIIHPNNKRTRDWIETIVLGEYGRQTR